MTDGGARDDRDRAQDPAAGDGTVARLAADLKAEAVRLGVARVGIADPGAGSDQGPFLRAWLDGGLHGEMGWLAREDAVRRRLDLRETLPGVRSVIVVADGYPSADAAEVPRDPAIGVIARYARGADYHRVLRGKLDRLQRWLQARLRSERRPGRVYVDTGPVLERELARRAGIGWFGRNTMLIDPARGSYVLLGALLLEIPLPPDPPFEEDRCGTCRDCLDACPTGALLGRDPRGAPVIDARRCISYLTIELRGPIPQALRPAIGNRVFGCDICQEVCPWNRRFPAGAATEPRYGARGPGELPMGVEAVPGRAEPHPGTRAPALVDLLRTALDQDSWESFSRGSPIRRAGREGFARNVAVALGNWGDPSGVPVLLQALEDPHPLVRGHAAWALGRVGSDDAVRSLREKAHGEGDGFVREEIECALEAASAA